MGKRPGRVNRGWLQTWECMDMGTISEGPAKMGMIIPLSFFHQGPVEVVSARTNSEPPIIGPTLLMYNLYEPAQI